MTLSVASLATAMSVLRFVKALFHAVDMWPRRFSKVSTRRFSPFHLSLSSPTGSSMLPFVSWRLWLVLSGSFLRELSVPLSSMVFSYLPVSVVVTIPWTQKTSFSLLLFPGVLSPLSFGSPVMTVFDKPCVSLASFH